MALGWSATDLGGLLYESLRTKLLALPDASLVYPAHGAGSLCGKALGQETFSTIGEQRRSNYALQPMSKAAFVELVTADQPDAPPYFTYDAVLNSKERPTLDETLAREVNPMTLDQLLALQTVGAQILDVRDPAEFASAHLAGSINIGLGGQFATWAGTVLSRDKPIVIIADPGREHEAATRLGRIGFDHVAGYLENGMASLESRPELTAHIERLSAQVAAERAAAGEPGARPLVLDVRTPREREEKRLEGSLGIPLNHLPSACRSCRATGRCSSTARAAIARRLPPASCSTTDSRGQRDCRRHHRVGGGEAARGDGRRRLTHGRSHLPSVVEMADELSVDHRDIRKPPPELEATLLHESNAGVVSLEQDAEQHALAEAGRLAHRVPHERRTDAATLSAAADVVRDFGRAENGLAAGAIRAERTPADHRPVLVEHVDGIRRRLVIVEPRAPLVDGHGTQIGGGETLLDGLVVDLDDRREIVG